MGDRINHSAVDPGDHYLPNLVSSTLFHKNLNSFDKFLYLDSFSFEFHKYIVRYAIAQLSKYSVLSHLCWGRDGGPITCLAPQLSLWSQENSVAYRYGDGLDSDCIIYSVLFQMRLDSIRWQGLYRTWTCTVQMWNKKRLLFQMLKFENLKGL